MDYTFNGTDSVALKYSTFTHALCLRGREDSRPQCMAASEYFYVT
jgi:hypothetical protein